MARIKAFDTDGTFWYQERGMGPSYVFTPDESQATDMPRAYAEKRLDDLMRVERWNQHPRTFKIVRSKLP